MVIRRLLVASALVISSVAIVPARSAPALDFADQVGHGTLPVAGGFHWDLRCEFQEPGVVEDMVMVALEFSDGWMPSSASVHPRRSAEGKVFQVGDQQFVEEERSERRPDPSTSFSAGGSVASARPAIAHVAIAFWDGTATDCSFVIDESQSVPITWYSGEHAFYAGPEAFSTGIFVQDGGTQASVGRTFSRTLTGGPLFGVFYVNGSEPHQGYVATDDPWLLDPVRFCGYLCDFARPHPTQLLAVATHAVELGGKGHNQLWVINPPAE